MDRSIVIDSSRDGGYNWSPQPRELSIGNPGDYQGRREIVARRMGSAKHFTFALETTSACRIDVLAVYAQVEPFA